jgi:DNA-binding CsgD family transcriptional regulator
MKIAQKPSLTPRQIDVVRLIVEGMTYRQIGERLGLSCESVKTYAARIREKLGVTTKVEVAVWGSHNLGGSNGRIDIG